MDLTLLSDPFYYENPNPTDVENMVGGLYYAQVFYIEPDIYELDYDNVDPKSGTYRFRVGKNIGRVENRLPIPELQLRSDESLYVLRGKTRPAIVLGVSEIDGDMIDELKLKYSSLAIVAPCFSYQRRHTENDKLECAAFQITDRFHLPQTCNGYYLKNDCFVDLSKIQPVPNTRLSPFKCKLTNKYLRLASQVHGDGKATECLIEWVIKLLEPNKADMELVGDMQAYGELLIENAVISVK